MPGTLHNFHSHANNRYRREPTFGFFSTFHIKWKNVVRRGLRQGGRLILSTWTIEATLTWIGKFIPKSRAYRQFPIALPLMTELGGLASRVSFKIQIQMLSSFQNPIRRRIFMCARARNTALEFARLILILSFSSGVVKRLGDRSDRYFVITITHYLKFYLYRDGGSEVHLRLLRFVNPGDLPMIPNFGGCVICIYTC